MKVIRFIFFLILCNDAVCQQEEPYLIWEKTFGRIEVENLYAMESTDDGGFVLGGLILIAETDDFFGNPEFIALEIDKNGEKKWERRYGGTAEDIMFAMESSRDQGYLLGGYSKSSDQDLVSGNRGESDFWIVKINSEGELVWEKSYGGTGEETIYSIKATDDGGYLLGGESSSKDGLVQLEDDIARGFWVVKVDSIGEIMWEKTFDRGPFNGLRSIANGVNEGFLLGGYTNSGGFGEGDFYVVKIRVDGSTEWERTYGGSEEDFLTASVKTTDGGYLLGGQSSSLDGDRISPGKGGADIWLIKIDSDGKIEWEESYGGSGDESLTAITETDDGYILGCNSNSDDQDIQSMNRGKTDIWVIKIDREGQLQWEKAIGGSSYDYVYSVKSHTEGGYMVGGYTNSDDKDISINHGYNDFWTIHLGVNHVPYIVDQTFYLDANTAIGPTSIAVVSSDEDNDVLTYSIISGDEDGRFAILNDGTLEVTQPLDQGKSKYDLHVQVTDDKHSDSANVVLFIGEVLGLEKRSEHIRIFPNPVSNVLLIDSQYKKNLQMQLVGKSGRILTSRQLVHGDNVLDCRELSLGMFYVRIHNANHETVHVQKLLKTK